MPPSGRLNGHAWRVLPMVAGIAVFVAAAAGSANGQPADGSYEYVSPIPGAVRVSPWNNIVIRDGRMVDPDALDAGGLSVVGSLSGRHQGELVVSDDSRTLVFDPTEPFALGEQVDVAFAHGARTLGGAELPPLSFHFTVSAVDPARQEPYRLEQEQEPLGAVPGSGTPPDPLAEWSPEPPPPEAFDPCAGLPYGFPTITITTLDHPDSGCVFISPYDYSLVGHLVIMDRLGEPVFYRRLTSLATDFKLQPNGMITYYQRDAYYGLDSTYAVVDSWRPGNGYPIDTHGMQLMPNGHALLMTYDQQPVRMDTIVAGGDPNAVVTGLVIQELDTAKHVVFQWRSWDHFQITDAADFIDLTAFRIDYVHGNSLEVDADGNLLLSSRHLNEITKISRRTGAILWRFGPNAKQNEFTVENDPRGFQAQHDVRRLPNGNITVFDNGNLLDPEYSRAVEYRLDEPGRTATQVWEYRHQPDQFGPSLGNVQRRESGGTMIDWGGTTSNPKVTDLNPDGSIGLELALGTRFYSYRVFRFPWVTTRFATEPTALDFGLVPPGVSASKPLGVVNTSDRPVTITCFRSTNPEFVATASLPFDLGPGQSLTANVTFTPGGGGDREGMLYVRSVASAGTIARSVTLHGSAGGVAAVDGRPLSFRLYDSRPNPFHATTTIGFDLPRASDVTLEVFDVQGRDVATLLDGPLPAGRHEARWNAAGAPSGLYFYRLEAGDFVATRKFAHMD